MTKALDKQVGGNHYKNFKFQPAEFIIANNLGFCEGNAIKYICRYKLKNGIEDLKKAKHYIEMLIEEEEGVKVPGRSLYDGDCLPKLPKIPSPSVPEKQINEKLKKIREDLQKQHSQALEKEFAKELNPSLHV